MRKILFLLFFIVSKIGFAKRPNVLFIIIDDLKPAIRGFGYESAYTPHIDTLAEKSFIFKNAFAQVSLINARLSWQLCLNFHCIFKNLKRIKYLASQKHFSVFKYVKVRKISCLLNWLYNAITFHAKIL